LGQLRLFCTFYGILLSCPSNRFLITAMVWKHCLTQYRWHKPWRLLARHMDKFVGKGTHPARALRMLPSSQEDPLPIGERIGLCCCCNRFACWPLSNNHINWINANHLFQQLACLLAQWWQSRNIKQREIL
jgi:hypothetical protein